MPILKIPDPQAPLSQGDILKGLRLYLTDANWSDSVEAGGSALRREDFELCIVVSRACVLEHKSVFIVAGVDFVREKVPDDIRSFTEVQEFLHQLREGYKRTDRFYLGQIAGQETGRYYAHLDSLHSVCRPSGTAMAEFLRTGRIATLSEEFRHDLFLRVFAAFANLGFDDVSWHSDHDLQWVLDSAQKDLATLKVEIATKQAELSGLVASGSAKNEKHLQSLTNSINLLKAKVDDVQRQLTKLQAESEKRKK